MIATGSGGRSSFASRSSAPLIDGSMTGKYVKETEERWEALSDAISDDLND